MIIGSFCSNPAFRPIIFSGMGSDAEAVLLARCRRGEAAAWDELFDLHYAPTARFLFQTGSDWVPEDVEELCQEVFLAVIRNLDSFQGGSQFQTWLFRIAVNKARDFRERQQAAKRGAGHVPLSLNAEDPATGLTLDAPSTAPGPDALLMAAEQGAQVHRALEQVGASCREVIELRYFADLSYDEIGLLTGINPKTVSSRLSKCLDRLEEILRRVLPREETRRDSV